jgi:hypothetical protein
VKLKILTVVGPCALANVQPIVAELSECAEADGDALDRGFRNFSVVLTGLIVSKAYDF